MQPIKVFIVDDHPLAVAGIQNLLQPYSHIHINGTFHTAADLLSQLERECPDVLLLDILLPDKNGKELAAVLTLQYPGIKTIAITSLDSPAYVRAMIRNGCSGYLLKNTDPATLVTAIEKVSQGEEFIEPSLKQQMLDSFIHYRKREPQDSPEQVHLTSREKDVLNLILSELNNNEIAEKLFLSVRTVERHRFNLMRKMEARSPLGLLKAAIEMGIIDPPHLRP